MFELTITVAVGVEIAVTLSECVVVELKFDGVLPTEVTVDVVEAVNGGGISVVVVALVN